MQNKISNILRSLNLKEREIMIFLYVFKRKNALIPQITAALKCSHMTVYRSIKKMEEMNLIELLALNDKQYLVKSKGLGSILKSIRSEQLKLRKIEIALNEMSDLLPFIDLDNLDQVGEDINYKEGLEDFKSEYLNIPSHSESEFLHIGAMQDYWNIAGMDYGCAEERYFIKTRMKKGIFARVIEPNNKQATQFKSRDSIEKRTTQIKENLPIMKNYLTLTEKQVNYFICDKENPRVYIIKNPDLVNLHHQNFHAIWMSS